MTDRRPKVSICLPNLNGRLFLQDRFDTIFAQTLQDWELIVYDSYSDDGSWEYIQQRVQGDPRVRVSQGPREGIYPAWNHCIDLARGEYVYIATADDTMAQECLERMVAALEANPDCGLCQCALVLIDEKGVRLPPAHQWHRYPLGVYNQALVVRSNKRCAPHDGLAYPALLTIYTSITQLLIRRRVFERIGLFHSRWGSIGDFEWSMRAGLLENCIYIPEELSTWRIHSKQATQDVNTPQVRLKMIEMARAAFARAHACVGERFGSIEMEDFIYFLKRDVVELGYQAADGYVQKASFLFRELLQRPRQVVDHLVDPFLCKSWDQFNSPSRYGRLDRMLHKYGVSSPLFQGEPGDW